MEDGPPDIIAINNDDHHAKHLGRTSDGRLSTLDPRQRAAVELSLNRFPPEDPNGVACNVLPGDRGPRTSASARGVRLPAWLGLGFAVYSGPTRRST